MISSAESEIYANSATFWVAAFFEHESPWMTRCTVMTDHFTLDNAVSVPIYDDDRCMLEHRDVADDCGLDSMLDGLTQRDQG